MAKLSKAQQEVIDVLKAGLIKIVRAQSRYPFDTYAELVMPASNPAGDGGE